MDLLPERAQRLLAVPFFVLLVYGRLFEKVDELLDLFRRPQD